MAPGVTAGWPDRGGGDGVRGWGNSYPAAPPPGRRGGLAVEGARAPGDGATAPLPRRPRTGVVLGAGGVLGAAWTAGALAALQRRAPDAGGGGGRSGGTRGARGRG